MTELEKTHVTIYTQTFRIEGKINLAKGERLTDYIHAAKEFMAVTDATVSTLDERICYQSHFLTVQRNRIEIIAPHEE